MLTHKRIAKEENNKHTCQVTRGRILQVFVSRIMFSYTSAMLGVAKNSSALSIDGIKSEFCVSPAIWGTLRRNSPVRAFAIVGLSCVIFFMAQA